MALTRVLPYSGRCRSASPRNVSESRDAYDSLRVGFALSLFVTLFVAVQGEGRLREFNRAPKSIQDAFFERVKAATERKRALAEYDPFEGHDDPGRHLEPPVWDEGWQRKASLARAVASGALDDIESERRRLLEIPAPVYFARLTGEEVPDTGAIVPCPSPEHEDRHPSCRVYAGHGWRCFACGEQGGIYQLGALVFGLGTRGAQFRELHSQLADVFGIEERQAA